MRREFFFMLHGVLIPKVLSSVTDGRGHNSLHGGRAHRAIRSQSSGVLTEQNGH